MVTELEFLNSLFPSIHAKHASGEVSPYLCPECGGQGIWRRGAEFEGEKLCMRDSVVWCPGAVRDYLAMKADIQFGHGDGI